jgi:hypothetical protein
MPNWLIYLCLTILVIALTVAGVFIFDPSWRKQRDVQRHVKQLRNRLHPVASALGVSVSVRTDEGSVSINYRFDDENNVSLVVTDDGFIYFPPKRKSGDQKAIEGLPILLAAIKNEYQKQLVAGVQ